MADWIENQFEESKRRFETLPDWLKEDYTFSEEDDVVEVKENNQSQETILA